MLANKDIYHAVAFSGKYWLLLAIMIYHPRIFTKHHIHYLDEKFQ